jgi:hypothetical protein
LYTVILIILLPILIIFLILAIPFLFIGCIRQGIVITNKSNDYN